MHKESEKITDRVIFEGMTSLRAVLRARGDASLKNDRRILRVFYDPERMHKIAKDVRWLEIVGGREGFPVLPMSAAEMQGITTGNTHGGIVAECSARTIPALTRETATLRADGFYVMLEGIEDPYNFGYALRSLYAMGVDGVILGERNWMSAAGVVARSSAGASELLPMATAKPEEAAALLRSFGYRVVCADVRTELLLPDADLKKPIFLVVGGEKRGISRALLDTADLTVKIFYAGAFEGALSAASAATILGYEIARQNR